MENEEETREKLVEQARIEAEEEVKQSFSPEQVSYEYYVQEAMRRILKEKGIEWKADEANTSID